MKRSDVLFWLVLTLIVGLVFWLITTGRLQAIASQIVDGYWKFLENIMNFRVRR